MDEFEKARVLIDVLALAERAVEQGTHDGTIVEAASDFADFIEGRL
ncbi:hypothetical protein SEA_MALTHUS_1 [Mycobacterium phage Malthus]|uniref:Gene 1 ring forming protein domain-containing protein n=1 Tax=Mycobacterium phage Malthus TaxID=2592661 RepID=A0A5Q2WP70_9CAUD|nr:hypothetical protein SEA_MALTHUS_1 [Mycobacterium phage Malthus]WRQ08389.1 hypothetical protein JDBV13_00370 [Mycobacterium phage june]